MAHVDLLQDRRQGDGLPFPVCSLPPVGVELPLNELSLVDSRAGSTAQRIPDAAFPPAAPESLSGVDEDGFGLARQPVA
ncbi:hypothetical protein HF563_13700 [Acidithiobacillus ferridurans]|nr:hypothetical protein [Acidithiobacillus ferridurans]